MDLPTTNKKKTRRIQILTDKVFPLDNKPKQHPVIEKLKSEKNELRLSLAKARDVIVEQESRINTLSAPPYPYATVVKTCLENNATKKPLWTDFKIGSKVSIDPSSPFSHQNDGIGCIVGAERKGWVLVEFSKPKFKARYRVGHPDINDGQCDLRLHSVKNISKSILVVLDGRLLEVSGFKKQPVYPGDVVKVNSLAQIVDIVGKAEIGETALVTKISDNGTCEVGFQDSKRVVYTGLNEVKQGDSVLLDASNTLVIRNNGPEDTRFHIDSNLINVTWDSIGGLDNVKLEMIEILEGPFKHKDIYEFYGKRPPKGIMMYGPPGCGKTMIAKATVNSIAKIHGKEVVSSGFIYVKGPELLSKWVGIAEESIRSLFNRAKLHKNEFGFPAIIFIDEADAILRKRGSGISNDVENTIVPMFLAEMDGMETSAAIVILATNRADSLDPAVIRDGRIDKKILIPRPNLQEAQSIFAVHLLNVPTNGEKEATAEYGAQEMYSSRWGLYEAHMKSGEKVSIGLNALASGAMIANVVEESITIAIRRDVYKKTKTGLNKNDIYVAIENIYNQQRFMDNKNNIKTYAESLGGELDNIVKVGPNSE